LFTYTGINLRERVTPMKYSLDNDHESSSSEDENGVIFPKEKTVVEKWLTEVSSWIHIIKLIHSIKN